MSNGTHDPDPIELLRHANPVATDRLPPGSEARLRARVLEEMMASNETTMRGAPRSRGLWPVLTGAAAMALAIAVVVGTGLVGDLGAGPGASPIATGGPGASSGPIAGGGSDPVPSGGAVVGGGMGMCAFTYDLDTLRAREWAFDGTVTAIDGNQLTFTVNRWFKGGEAASITVTADGMTAESPLGGPGLAMGGRYLVTGDDEFAWSCGFTQDWSDAVAAEWARVFGD